MALTRFASNKLSASRPTLTSRANNAKRFTNIRANSLNISNPAIPSAYFIFTTATPALQEGISTTVTVQGYNLAVAAQNGTYYWTIESNAGDFDASSGSFTLTSAGNLYGYSAGSFTLTPTGDGVQEGTETFTIAIRSGSISGPIISTSLPITINDQAADTYFNFVTLLLSSNGVNNANNKVFVDSSTNNFAITRNGNATQGSFTPPFGDYINSIYVGGGGSSGYLTPSNYGLTINGAFTFEAWVYLTTADRNQIFGEPYGGAYSTSYGIGFVPGGQVYAPGISPGLTFGQSPISGYGNNYAYGAGLGYPSLHTWTHVAICRDSNNNWHFYQNGVKGTTSNINAYVSGNVQFPANNGISCSFVLPLYMFNYDGQIGGGNSAYMSAGFNGYLADVRVVNGTALYTGASLTVPTSRLTAIQNTEVLLGKNGFTNTANTALKFTPTSVSSTGLKGSRIGPVTSTSSPYSTSVQGGSAYFDGSGDYLNTATSALLSPQANPFTMECWVYVLSNNSGANRGIFALGASNAGSQALMIYQSGAEQKFGIYNGSAGSLSTNTIPLNSLVHLAFVREGTGTNQTKLYVNGVLSSTTTFNNTFVSPMPAYIGQNAWGEQFHGYIAAARFVKGFAVSTGNFTPPTTPLTTITNTQLLCNFTNAGIYDSSFSNNLETVGDVKISTTQSKFGGSSMYFDGTGDYLTAPSGYDLTVGGGAFTIEAWVYLTGVQTQTYGYQIAGTYPASGNGWAIVINRSAGGEGIAWANGSPVGIQVSYNSYLNTNQWYHIAIVRTSTASNGTKIYLDGVAVATGTDATNDAVLQTLYIGSQGPSACFWPGYIDDLRITKGFARYTANFTPPALSLPTQ